MKKRIGFILVVFFLFSFSVSAFSQQITPRDGKVVSLKGGYKFNNIQINFENCSKIFVEDANDPDSKTRVTNSDIFSKNIRFAVSNPYGSKVYFSAKVLKRELYYNDLDGYTIEPRVIGGPSNHEKFKKIESSIIQNILFFPNQTKQFDEDSTANMHGDFKDPVVRYREVEREDGSIEQESYTEWVSSRDLEFMQLIGFFYEIKDTSEFKYLCDILRIPYVVGASSGTILVPVGGRTASAVRWVLDYVYGVKPSDGLERYLMMTGKK